MAHTLAEHAYDRSPREAIADVMSWMYMRGLVQVRGGNASIVDRKEGIVYMSPTGVPRPLLRPRDVSVLTLEGRILYGRPTSEWRMHLAIYKSQPRAVSIVHAHPKHLLTITVLGLSIDPTLLSEAGIQVSCLGRVPYIKPGTAELAEAVGRVAGEGCNAIILERHGAVVWSDRSIYHALDLLEALEDLALMTLNLHLARHRQG